MVGIAERAIVMRKMIDKLSPNSHLNPFNGIHNKHPQLPVEGVMLPYQVQHSAWFIGIVRVRITERMQVSAKAVIIDSGQSFYKIIRMGNQAAIDELLCLLFEGEWWLSVFHYCPHNKKPTEFRMLSRGAAGMLVSLS
jgi:hypothetical protein